MKKILDIMTGWPILIFQSLLLALICWPMADHGVSYFWLLMAFGVLLGEGLNKWWWSPKKQTVSNDIRDESISSNRWARVRFWLMISVWLWFSVTLALHFMKRVIL